MWRPKIGHDLVGSGSPRLLLAALFVSTPVTTMPTAPTSPATAGGTIPVPRRVCARSHIDAMIAIVDQGLARVPGPANRARVPQAQAARSAEGDHQPVNGRVAA